MSANKPYEVGQQVKVGGGYGYHGKRTPLRDGTVEKVGRILVHVRLSAWQVVAFDMETGRQRTENHARYLTTEEQEAERLEAHETRRRLAQELQVTGNGIHNLSPAALREVERIVREDRER